MNQDTIVAIASPSGIGALGIIRLSGNDAITIVNKVFPSKNLENQKSHTLHVGKIQDGDHIYDEVVVSLFIAPKSYTKENVVEISCHGSPFIIESLIQLFLSKGARLANPGEFTQRAFLNGGLDLAQAEAVADLIAADTQASQKVAMNQLRGGFSRELGMLREELIHFASMLELELDFSEEEVEFADRTQLTNLIQKMIEQVEPLVSSFKTGNVIKNGVATVLVGKPNAGKSTLLNALLKEDKAIVSDIAGTTRDSLEDIWTLGGIRFRLVDTAGLRETTDTIEAIGVERTKNWMKKSQLILLMIDLSTDSKEDLKNTLKEFSEQDAELIVVLNKLDQVNGFKLTDWTIHPHTVCISAKTGKGIKELEKKMLEIVEADLKNTDATMVTNLRHYEQLKLTLETLETVKQGIQNSLTNDFLAQDLRHALYHLGQITGSITNDDLLKNIFGKFCIGK
ncbi:MAG: tRNA modification GTPase MnmE [Bacteroidota bacterium]|jgi:tRNA modification GTPase